MTPDILAFVPKHRTDEAICAYDKCACGAHPLDGLPERVLGDTVHGVLVCYRIKPEAKP